MTTPVDPPPGEARPADGAGAAGRLAGRLKVTVIMPALNEAASVDETMASIFSQTRPPDEVVVADGGSRDGTPELVLKHAGKGIAIKVVSNPGVYSGAGRNAATRAASHDIIIGMDFSNKADPRYIEALVRAFEADPLVDYVGGPAYPIMESAVERACAAVICPDLTRIPHIPLDELMRIAPKDFIPAGFNLAYRRSVWERANGFWDAAGACEDPLFGYRVRQVGGKIAPVGDAIVNYHMARSLGEMWRRYGRYARWNARMGLNRRPFAKLLCLYIAGLVLIAAAVVVPALWALIALLLLVYIYLTTWRKANDVGRDTGKPFTPKERATAVVVRVIYDLSTLYGNLMGYIDLLKTPQWRRCKRAYLERGEQIDPLGRFAAATGQYT
ncbi:MAG: glycosyltransferase [Planctomycetota bacterium]|nr:glycosyltransferase [Planctomycetota bacterium]